MTLVNKAAGLEGLGISARQGRPRRRRRFRRWWSRPRHVDRPPRI